jgi:hypothetical protein
VRRGGHVSVVTLERIDADEDARNQHAHWRSLSPSLPPSLPSSLSPSLSPFLPPSLLPSCSHPPPSRDRSSDGRRGDETEQCQRMRKSERIARKEGLGWVRVERVWVKESLATSPISLPGGIDFPECKEGQRSHSGEGTVGHADHIVSDISPPRCGARGRMD